MRRWRTGGGGVLSWLSLVCAGTLAMVGCGAKKAETGRSGGAVTVTYPAFPDALDPALARTQTALQTLRAVYTPLLSYSHEAGAKGATVVPGLADALPKVSFDGLTYGLKLREGLRYSDGSVVHASDFEQAIRRVLSLKSPGAKHFLDIVGAAAYVRGGKPDADIAGIATSDRTNSLTIALNRPDRRFSEALALEYGALVPGDTPLSDQTKSPPPGVGPYTLSGVQAGTGFALVKVPGFALDGLPAGKLDRLSVRVASGGAADYAADPPVSAAGTRVTESVTRATLPFGARTLTAAFSDRIDTEHCVVWNPAFSLDLAQLCVK